MAQKPMQLALLFDYDNLTGFSAKGIETEPLRPYSHLDVLAALESHYGPVVFCKAYGDWAAPRTRRTIGDLMKTGAELQFVSNAIVRIPGYSASCIGITALELAYTHSNIDGFVIGSNEMSLVPVISKLHSLGKRVFILGADISNCAAVSRIADDFISLPEPSYVKASPSPRAPSSIDKKQINDALKNLLHNGEMTIAELEEKLSAEVPEFNLTDYGYSDFEDFLRNMANTTVKLNKPEDASAPTTVALGNCHNASAYSDEELQGFNLAEYMQATRWHITDGGIRDTVLHNIYVVFSEKGREMTNEELRTTVDPDRVVEDRPWQGTIWSLIFGACLWENPKTASQPQNRRLLSLFRTVTDEDDFMVRYYTSLFKKAFEDRPQLTPRDCAMLMHPENVDGALPLFERVFENLKNPVMPKSAER